MIIWISCRYKYSGLLTGKYTKNETFDDLSRMNNPLFQREAYLTNLKRVEQLKEFALNKGVETAQVALAWLLTRPRVDIIIPGAKRPDQIKSNIQTLNVHLSEDEIQSVSDMFKI
ncbi:aryl-alcohol dehydrogenase-like predicted oxidoreductase [Paenibacillus sp. V4I3]|nr:aryl-alcohol dehydrogenase-like predicted oxidoreductase [Paenibacillus sp. V4I3]